MSYYSVLDGLLFKSYLPGHLKKRSTFRDQLVVSETLVGFILHAYHGPSSPEDTSQRIQTDLRQKTA